MEVEDAFCIVFPPLPSKKKEENKEETEEKEEKEEMVEEEGKEEKKKKEENLTFSYLLSELEKDVNQLACVNADSGCIGNVLSSLQFEFTGEYVVFHMPLQIDLSESVWLDPKFIAEDVASVGKNVFQFAIDRINFRSLGKRDLEVFGIVDTSAFHVISNIIHHTTAPSGRNKTVSSVKMVHTRVKADDLNCSDAAIKKSFIDLSADLVICRLLNVEDDVVVGPPVGGPHGATSSDASASALSVFVFLSDFVDNGWLNLDPSR
jgi:hypothetical protein